MLKLLSYPPSSLRTDIEYDEQSQAVLAGEQVPEVMASLKGKLNELETFDAPSIKAAIRAVQKETGHKGETCLCRYVSLRQARQVVQNYLRQSR